MKQKQNPLTIDPLTIHVVNETRTPTTPLKNLLLRVAAVLAAQEGLFPRPCEVTLVVAADKKVAQLNGAFRGKPVATDVLSFPQLEGTALTKAKKDAARSGTPLYLGDIILGFSTVKKAAKAQKKTLEQHLTHLVVHGMLHLLGYDHVDSGAARRMEKLEIMLLASLGVANPYNNQEVPARIRRGKRVKKGSGKMRNE